LRQAIAELGGDIVFSHNDLLCNNILIENGSAEKIWFIDYEYAKYNVRGYDIANYFVES
jgi:ethanolamine kinase